MVVCALLSALVVTVSCFCYFVQPPVHHLNHTKLSGPWRALQLTLLKAQWECIRLGTLPCELLFSGAFLQIRCESFGALTRMRRVGMKVWLGAVLPIDGKIQRQRKAICPEMGKIHGLFDWKHWNVFISQLQWNKYTQCYHKKDIIYSLMTEDDTYYGNMKIQVSTHLLCVCVCEYSYLFM